MTRCLQSLVLLFLILFFLGDLIFSALKITPPQLLKEITGSYIALFIFIALGIYTVPSSMGVSGAYEVYLDGNKIFSKFEKKRVAEPDEIVASINAKLSSR